MEKLIKYSFLSVLLSVFFCCKKGNESKITASVKDERPNIVLIMADDMGYSDIGCYGGEIPTPNIDALASGGVRFSQFYNAGRCCPTRASLLTGKYAHEVGMGWMTSAHLGSPGYVGDLSPEHATIAEILQKNGYHTYMSGKWHLTSYDKLDEEPFINDSWPLQRGFNNFYGTLGGAGSFFHPENLVQGNTLIDSVGSDYYYTNAISEMASNYINEHLEKKDRNPFFMYVAYTAPHFPLHAPDSIINKYLDVYKQGWDILMDKRLNRMKSLGLAIPSQNKVVRDTKVPSWSELGEIEKRDMIKRMAIYAAQMEIMDEGIGKIITTLKEKDAWNNTMIIFLSDNGGTAERISKKDKSYEAMGSKASYESYRRPWANLGNLPFREYKKYMHEGGIATPLIVHWPESIDSGGIINNEYGHVIDLAPTLLEVANAQEGGFEGKSLISALHGKSLDVRPIFWEHEANRAVRYGDWKLVSFASKKPPYVGKWELYDLSLDRNESNDLADTYPDKVTELSNMWNRWANTHKVFPLDGRSWNERIKKP